MFRWLTFGKTGSVDFLFKYRQNYSWHQKYSLVNVKLKWAKDRSLDAFIAGERELRAACILVSIIYSDPNCCLPVYHLRRHRRELNLPDDLKVSTFIRRYPTVFHELSALDSGGTPVPWFKLTSEAIDLHKEELNIIQRDHLDSFIRIRKLLMLTRERILPLQTIDQLKWDMGLPYDYHRSIIPHHPEIFSTVRLADDRVGLKLIAWDNSLAVSELQKNALLQQEEEHIKNSTLAFPVSFTRGFGLKRKCMRWLEEWQTLPYTSPYSNADHLDPRTDVSEKRIVGVFHELLHLMIQKKTERKNVSNLRKPLSLPQKFTKVFERHPGIFYISKKCDTQTVVLREAYNRDQLLKKHAITEIREKFATMMKKGQINRSRGLYKISADAPVEDDNTKEIGCDELSDETLTVDAESESDCGIFSEYDSDENLNKPC